MSGREKHTSKIAAIIDSLDEIDSNSAPGSSLPAKDDLEATCRFRFGCRAARRSHHLTGAAALEGGTHIMLASERCEGRTDLDFPTVRQQNNPVLTKTVAEAAPAVSRALRSRTPSPCDQQIRQTTGMS